MIRKSNVIGKKFSLILVLLFSMFYTEAAVADGNSLEDGDVTGEAWDMEESGEEVKKKLSFNAKIVMTLLLSGLGTLFLYIIYSASTGGKKGGKFDDPPVFPKAKIKSNGCIKAFADEKLIVRTKFDYQSTNIYQAMGGYDPKDVCLTNGANPALATGGGGTNAFLTTLINGMVDKKHTGEKNTWGLITDMDEKAWQRGRGLTIGEYAFSVHDTGVTIAHMLGPVEKSKENLAALQKGITELLTYLKKKNAYEVIVLAGIGAGIYSKNAGESRMTFQAIIDGLEDFYATAGDDFKKPILCLNYWDMKHLEGMENIPEVQKLK